MPKYQKGTAGKLIIQDYAVVETFDDTPILYILTKREAGMLLAITQFLHWQTRWQNVSDWDVVEQLVSETEFNLMNPITCAMLQECLGSMIQEQLDDLKRDIRYGDDSGVPPGENPPPEQNTENLATDTNPECDKDITWAQCTQLVEWAVRIVTDTLEIAESATNDTELLAVFGDLPLINELGVASLFSYIDLLMEGVAENFSAQITEEYKEELACRFFQTACNDCEITVEKLYSVMNEKLSEHFIDFPTAFGTIYDLWTYLSDQDIDGTIIADVMIQMLFAGGYLANTFFSAVGIKPIQIVLALAVNDANDDWLILCPDCPNCAITFTIGQGTDLMDGWIESDDTPEEVDRLDTVATGWAKRGWLDLDTPATRVKVEVDTTNLGGGSDDTMYVGLGEFVAGEFIGTVVHADNAIQEVVVDNITPASRVYFDIGYASEGGAALYLNNECKIRVIEICE